jgi:Spy/CpxP family protein refolding chaperone
MLKKTTLAIVAAAAISMAALAPTTASAKPHFSFGFGHYGSYYGGHSYNTHGYGHGYGHGWGH